MKKLTSERVMGLLLLGCGILILLGTLGVLRFGHHTLPSAVLLCLAVAAALGYRAKGLLVYLAAAEILAAVGLAVFLGGLRGVHDTLPAALVFMGIALVMLTVHLKTGRHQRLAAAALFPAVLSMAMLSGLLPFVGDTLPPVVFLFGMGLALFLLGPLAGKGVTKTIYPALVLWAIAVSAFLGSFHGLPGRMAGPVFLLGLSTPFLLGFLRSRRWIFLILGYVFLLLGLATSADAIRFLPDIMPAVIILYGAALLFLLGFLMNADRWWCALVAGLLGVLGLVCIADALTGGAERYLWFIFLAGSSLIFGFLYFMRDPRNNLEWAKYPSVVLAVSAVLVLTSGWAGSLAISLALIGVGAILVFKHFRGK